MVSLASAPPVHERWVGKLLHTWLFGLIVVLPLSIQVYSPGPDLEVILPSELLIALACVHVGAMVVFNPKTLSVDRRFLSHPISVLVLASLGIDLVATAFSTMPLVSAKAAVVKVAHLFLFYFVLGGVFRSIKVAPVRSLWIYSYVFLAVVVYTVLMQAGKGFDRAGSSFASFPFYGDHTIYGAALVFVLFWFAGETGRSWQERGHVARSTILSLVTLGLAIALYVSFCRAAWVSVFVSLAAWAVFTLGGRLWTFLGAGATAVAVAIIWSVTLAPGPDRAPLDSNSDDAAGRASLLSLVNVRTDHSNRERLNRWSCAYRMFLDRPWTGFGPGTFQFKYTDYQRPEEMTYTSVKPGNSPKRITRAWSFTDDVFVRANPQILNFSGGTAHSEYLLALSGSGVFAMGVFIALFVCCLRTGIHLLDQGPSGRTRIDALVLMACLIAYFTHALFNNYLDNGKIAFLFWTSLALLARMDVERARDAST
ncbi:MAG: O-antigen ligase family protein [Flavobacteriales bacterium]|nr:O-antigen ligase family protein [Flavobacteriales bacterium]MBK7269737.1 O-antigen ligase family protein [Flavobacteriales bacterium]MBK7752576.1 O-antigen ligase family protein [Flavobacteriales bacterium]MBK9076753.1 O-antigen ligase family protein [Flavobacteriales bacterium]MBK9538167.1 O-antigen ligase family protein [Flavobacteriales bacterium]